MKQNPIARLIFFAKSFGSETVKAKPLLNLLGLLKVNNIYCQQVLKFSLSRHKGLLPEVLDNTFQYASIVNLGTGYETLGISKAGTIQSQLDVEPTMTLHNRLFLVRKLISNKLVEAFDCRKKRVFLGFCAGSRPKKRTKT